MSSDPINNIARYKSGFGKVTHTFRKITPVKIVPGYTPEQMKQAGMVKQSYPTPKK
jgi:hypothetical protein